MGLIRVNPTAIMAIAETFRVWPLSDSNEFVNSSKALLSTVSEIATGRPAVSKPWDFLVLALTVISVNIEGLAGVIQGILSRIYTDYNGHVLFLRETHRRPNSNSSLIPKMRLAIKRQHEKYSISIFIKPELVISITSKTEHSYIEILTIDTDNFSITFVYMPPGKNFSFESPGNLDHKKTCVISDISITCSYSKNTENGNLVIPPRHTTSVF